MRLRYLHVEGLPPLNDIAIPFGYERILGRECAIRFIVGVNGSGKSRLLQAIAEIFLTLEARRLPPFPVTLAYDLGKQGQSDESDQRRTIYLRHPDSGASSAVLIEFERVLPSLSRNEWSTLETIKAEQWMDSSFERPYSVRNGPYRGDDLPGVGSINSFLPQVVLAYTSGATGSWTALFTPDQGDEEAVFSSLPELPGREQERPLNWDQRKEADYQRTLQDAPVAEADITLESSESIAGPDDLRTRSIGLYVSPDALKLAFCAVALHQLARDVLDMPTEEAEQAFLDRIERAQRDDERLSGLRGLLSKVDWLWPVTITLHINLQTERLTRQQRSDLARLYRSATSVVRESVVGTSRRLIYDLRRPLLNRDNLNPTTVAALIEAIVARDEGDDREITPFDVFSRLRNWQQDGILDNVTITLRKRGVQDVLLYDWLSDGERVFLGRMALFQLLGGESDALVLLDEPETHFNDVWKREIVDIIDTSLQQSPSEIVISTHSSITLTDVFETEITLLRKDPSTGTIVSVRPQMPTFGASPTEIMTGIFNASEPVGQRATEFLDLILTIAAHPEQVQTIWSLDGNDEAIRRSKAFQNLLEFTEELPHSYGSDENGAREQYLLNALRSVREYTQQQQPEKTEITVVDALTELQKRIGPGYYQFEFRRRLRSLRESNGNAPSH